MRDLTRTENPGAKFGGEFHFPKISTSRSIAPQFPGRPLTHSAASCKPSQTAMTHVKPFDVSESFVPGFTPAKQATQTSGLPPNIPSTSPRGSLFGSPSFGTHSGAALDSNYGAMPETEGDPGFKQAGNDRSMNSPAPPRYPSRNSFRQPAPVAGSYYPSSFPASAPSRVFSWDSNEESRFAAHSPSAQLPQPAVSHMYIGGDFDDARPAASLLDRRSRSAQNKPSAWDRLTTQVSRASKFIFGKGPKHSWP
jgi:hypothetical protein